jgi:hypothetical protein
MKNTVTSYTPESRSLGSCRKEAHGLYRQYMILDLSAAPYPCAHTGMPTHPAVVTVRVYWPASTAYACVWLNLTDSYAVGKGKAGGYGYCKESAAIDDALRSAGIQLEHSIHGVGEQAVKGALVALAEFAGLTNYTVAIAHA